MSELRKFDEPIELQRLRKLQILIETDMWFNKNVELYMGTWKSEKKCGTTACLCGMYTIAYPEDGLEIIVEKINADCSTFDLVYGELMSLDAAAIFFGLTDKDSMWLFCEDSYMVDERGVFLENRKRANCRWIFEQNPRIIKAEALKRVKFIIEREVNDSNHEIVGSNIAR